jgi:hypothetical protein
MAEDRQIKQGEIQLNGKLITSQDPSVIGPNFQSLKNMRYTDSSIKGLEGMTKINTSAISTYTDIKNGFHFEKEQPAESHVLVQAANAGDTERKVFENTTAIPSAGNFSATALHTDDSDAGEGIFSDAPNGNVAYCNGKEALIWGGDEHFTSGFIVTDPSLESFFYDYTEEVQNVLTDSGNIATLKTVTNAASGTLLLHLDNNVTDSSPVSPHTVTNNNVTFTTSSKFGTHAGVFNGTDAYLTVPDNADFDFSGGNFTIDFWFKPAGNANTTIFSQSTDANNYIQVDYSIWNHIELKIVSGGATVVLLGASTLPELARVPDLENGEYHYIEITEAGDEWYLFINGKLIDHHTDVSRAANYTNPVHIGAFFNGAVVSKYIDATIDEFRISLSSGHSNYYDVPDTPYGTSSANIYIGATRPIQGAKFYVETANTSAGVANAMQWSRFDAPTASSDNGDSGQWVDVDNIVDGTSSGGITLAQTGSISFDNTEDTAIPRLFDGVQLYWYRFTFPDADDTTTISYSTVDMDMQQVKDLWDGETRKALHFAINAGVEDNTVNVFEPTYDSANSATFASIGGTTGFLIAGFEEQMSALDIRFVTGQENTNLIELAIQSWSGDAWNQVNVIDDGTYQSSAPFGKSGVISWVPSLKVDEAKQSIDGRIPLYYYRILAPTAYSANVDIFHISGIPAPKPIKGYKFPVYSQNRLFLCSETDDRKNKVTVSATGTPAVYNGIDSTDLFFGDEKELTAGIGLYNTFNSNLYEFLIITKSHETWVLEGNSINSWKFFTISRSKGCIAPLTMDTIEGGEGGANFAIWQGARAIHASDGRNVIDLSDDIEDLFDTFTSAQLAASNGFFDPSKQEYHWIVADQEWVLDWRRKKWFQADRGTGNELTAGFRVSDTDGREYSYGCIDSGFMFRLENGGQFNGSDIAYEFQTGDVLLTEPQGSTAIRGSVWVRTIINKIKLLAKAKSTTADKIVVSHFGDTETTASKIDTDGNTTVNMEPVLSGSRLINAIKDTNLKALFHSLKFTRTTDDGFEPVYLGVLYKDQRRDS